MDAEQVKLEDSNMANYGGEDHRNAAKAAAQTELEYQNAGTQIGIEIWRVENRRTAADTPDFGIKRWPKEQYGEFHVGDSYIILNTYKKPDAEALLWDVHFWLGKETTQDEMGVAAYKTVELDDLLDDGPIQHRETQGHESSLFQSYFKNGITYLAGGIESGFRKVKPEEYKPRLLEVKKSKKTTRATEVPCSVSSMNKTDCYVLDLGLKVYKYLGEYASPFEKSKAATVASNIVAGREGKAQLVEISDDEDFWATLGGSEADVAEEEPARSIILDGEVDASAVKMFQISDETGTVCFNEVEMKGNGYTRGDLDSGDIFLVNSGISLFLWIGSGSSKREKSQSWKLVDQYIKEHGIYKNIPVSLIKEGQVNFLFDACFVS